MNFFKKLFGTGKKKSELPENKFTDEEYERDYLEKVKGLTHILGDLHDLVGHAIIPFDVGGAVDMYYFLNHISGTGFATMEILEPDGSGPLPNRLGTYELVAFTKYGFENNSETQSPFGLIERALCGVFTKIGFYSRMAVLNPGETCEIPNDKNEENTCVVFDLYEPEGKKFIVGEREHHLLLCIQIFRSEVEFAMENGSSELFKKLKEAGHYPYSDLDRDAVA